MNEVGTGERLLQYVLVDVFADQPYAGNQLAVFPEAGELSTEQMQRIARELNLAETAFVTPPADEAGRFRVRIFTPVYEMPFAGHPTIGTACVLATRILDRGRDSEVRLILDENVGPLEVEVRREGNRLHGKFKTATLPEFGPSAPDVSALARLLGIDTTAISRGPYAPQSISCGVPYLIVKVASRQVLASIRIDSAEWEATIAPYWARQIYVITEDTELPSSSYRARMFAKWLSVIEDSATGSAAAALGAYLAPLEAEPNGRTTWKIEQGYEVGRPSLLGVEVEMQSGELTSIAVDGTTVIVGGGSLLMP